MENLKNATAGTGPRARTSLFLDPRRIGGALVALALAAAPVGFAVAAPSGTITAIGAENEYADVVAQIGGKYVQVTAVVSDPNTDPHSFEVSPKVAADFAAADLIVKNGIGYDAWADKIIAATPKPSRKVIGVQQVLNLPDDTPNPHLWYRPACMPALAKAVTEALSGLQPQHAGYFQDREKRFEASLQPWMAAIASFKAAHAGTRVAVTEPVADYLLEAAGIDIATPFSLQAAIMNGTDPTPQDITAQNNLFKNHQVQVFIYNQQVTDALTQSFLQLAKSNGIPVVGVYETMPAPGFTFQSWMLAEVDALNEAVTRKQSTETLKAGK